MKAVSLIASASISALGRGQAAFALGPPGAPAPCALRAEAGVPVGRVADASFEHALPDRAANLLRAASTDLWRALDARLPDWRSRRVLVCIGTSAGAMASMQAAFAARSDGTLSAELAARANYFSPLAALGELPPRVNVIQVLGACASSTLALGLACRSLDQGECDLAIAGGYDALSAFVSTGFDALGALTHVEARPFRSERDGLALGEGAALLALIRSNESVPEIGRILGFGASADAVHITAPDREGRGLARAAEAALLDAGLRADAVDWVNAHATATSYNDAAEAKALAHVFGARVLPVHPFKASIGHTLGAAGALESLATWEALGRGLVPAAAGSGALESAIGVELLAHNRSANARVALKLSAAFGGLNAALVLGAPEHPDASSVAEVRAVTLAHLSSWVTRADASGVTELVPSQTAVVARADSLSELALAAVGRLVREHTDALPKRTAVVVGTGLATLELNQRFDERRRAGLAVFPRAFPPTSPNLCAGVCSIAFGFTGPAFSVGASLAGAGEEAFRAAALLVAAGDVEAALVVLVEDAGPVTDALLEAAGRAPVSRRARAALLLPDAAGGQSSQMAARAWASRAAESG